VDVVTDVVTAVEFVTLEVIVVVVVVELAETIVVELVGSEVEDDDEVEVGFAVTDNVVELVAIDVVTTVELVDDVVALETEELVLD